MSLAHLLCPSYKIYVIVTIYSLRMVLFLATTNQLFVHLPQKLTILTYSGRNQNDSYLGQTQVQYSCTKSLDKIEGNEKVTFMLSGKWSTPPECVFDQTYLVKIVPPITFVLILLTAILIAAYFYQKKKKKITLSNAVMTRSREADAYVCFNFDTDNDYVM